MFVILGTMALLLQFYLEWLFHMGMHKCIIVHVCFSIFYWRSWVGVSFHTLPSPESLSKDLLPVWSVLCSKTQKAMGAKGCLFPMLMCLSAVGTSVWGLCHSSFSLTWEFSCLDRSSPENSFVVEFSREAGPSKRWDWRPLLQVSRSHPEELKGLNKVALWLLGILAVVSIPVTYIPV